MQSIWSGSYTKIKAYYLEHAAWSIAKALHTVASRPHTFGGMLQLNRVLGCSVSFGVQLAMHDTLLGCLFIPYLMRLPGNMTSLKRTIAKDRQSEEKTK